MNPNKTIPPDSVSVVAEAPAFVSRLVRLPLLDADGDPVGRITDVVLAPSGSRLRVLGL
ncbi:MAG: PRC-barrel domain-containing protein, partial [Acidimicrobiales bacterium]|nr:PRC-barrel domain-containing protein [Acidimicrobiales bacterium]